jgi:flagellar motor component MotA
MTILGLTIGISAVFVGYVGEGGDSVWVLLHPFAWSIVFGGALGCGLIGPPMAHGKHPLKTALSGKESSAKAPTNGTPLVIMTQGAR